MRRVDLLSRTMADLPAACWTRIFRNRRTGVAPRQDTARHFVLYAPLLLYGVESQINLHVHQAKELAQCGQIASVSSEFA